jgi:hypothetical protein
MIKQLGWCFMAVKLWNCSESIAVCCFLSVGSSSCLMLWQYTTVKASELQLSKYNRFLLVSLLCHWIVCCENVPHGKYEDLLYFCAVYVYICVWTVDIFSPDISWVLLQYCVKYKLTLICISWLNSFTLNDSAYIQHSTWDVQPLNIQLLNCWQCYKHIGNNTIVTIPSNS